MVLGNPSLIRAGRLHTHVGFQHDLLKEFAAPRGQRSCASGGALGQNLTQRQNTIGV
jgi:hypothetical protein